MNSVIIVDKPSGWTSHDVVNRMRSILGERSIGHLGTLDPLATGVLPLVIGSFTRLAQFYMASEKSYEGIIRFGFATNTYDADGEPEEASVRTVVPSDGSAQPLGCASPTLALDLESLQDLATTFVGLIDQTPPPFSAKKIKGIPAYKLARKQKEVNLQPVQIEIKEFTITAINGDRAQFLARVSSGTYMRSIAHEMGQRLGCGAHLETLRRTAVAEFDIAQARSIEEIEAALLPTQDSEIHKTKACHSDRTLSFPKGSVSAVEESALPAATAVASTTLFIHPRLLLPRLPSVTADEPTVARIRSGRAVNLPDLSRAHQIKVFENQTDLIAIATRIAGTLFHPKIVFPR